jgi:DNA end-binding protein Ku
MPQAIWTGTIGFGLVSIPVRLYPATEPKDVRFHLYDRASGKRVRLARVTRDDDAPTFVPEPRSLGGLASLPAGAELRHTPPADVEGDELDEDDDRPATLEPQRGVAAHEIVRGYQLPSGDLVTIEDDELEAIRPERSRNIEVEEFVDLADIDPVYFEKSYYLAPGRGAAAEKPYALLLRAMRSAGQVAIGRFVLRTRPHLVAIRPLDSVLALETLYFGDEVRSPDELVRGAGAQVSEREVETAKQLISALASEWVPERHGDEYREQLLDMLRSKAPQVAAPEETPAGAPVDDLMAALKASVEAAKEKASDYPVRTRRRG